MKRNEIKDIVYSPAIGNPHKKKPQENPKAFGI